MPGPGAYLIGDEEKKSILEVIESGWLYRYGTPEAKNFKAKVLQLEEDLIHYTGARYAVALSSGTGGLFVGMGALGIGPGDEVIVPGYGFIASLGTIVYSRAVPVLAEVDRSLTLDPDDVRTKITPRTKAVMLVHTLGNPGRIDEIKKITDEHNLFLIEDAAQAFGATYKGKSVGTYGDVGTFSFNYYKMLTAGDGGALVTDREDLYQRAFAIHDQGFLPKGISVKQDPLAVLGLNFKMGELSAAVILAQLKKIDMLKARLKEIKARFREGIQDIKELQFRDLPDPQGEISTLLPVFMPDAESARRLGDKLGCGVLSESGWHVYKNMQHILDQKSVDSTGCPFTCPHFTGKGGSAEYHEGMLPKTDALLERAINISIGVSDAGLGSAFGVSVLSTDEEIDAKIEEFRNCVRESV
jgi:dTDP-4-amino-4,6-dideoxygalactose transaminase